MNCLQRSLLLVVKLSVTLCIRFPGQEVSSSGTQCPLSACPLHARTEEEDFTGEYLGVLSFHQKWSWATMQRQEGINGEQVSYLLPVFLGFLVFVFKFARPILWVYKLQNVVRAYCLSQRKALPLPWSTDLLFPTSVMLTKLSISFLIWTKSNL